MMKGELFSLLERRTFGGLSKSGREGELRMIPQKHPALACFTFSGLFRPFCTFCVHFRTFSYISIHFRTQTEPLPKSVIGKQQETDGTEKR